MKKFFAFLLMLAAVCVMGSNIGCGKKDTPSGPVAENTYALEPPTSTTTIKQGESADVKVAVKRGKKFEDDVKLKLEAPKDSGLSVEDTTVAKGSTDAKVTVKAAETAKEGEHTITVTGSPKDLKSDFKVKVTKK